MAARRTTNNSVSTLEEQNEILETILTKENKDSDLKKKDKSRKRKDKSEQPLKTPKVKKPAVTETRFIEHEGSEADMESGVWPTWSDAQAAAHAQAMQYAKYGNAVPGFNFGEVEPPLWDQDLESNDSQERHVHEISEGEESENLEPSEPESQEVPVVPEVKISGVFGKILKQNISHVKEADRVAPKLAPEVAFGVEKYLKECVYTADMDKLSKQHPRVENVESMKVPRLDSEVYQVLDLKIRNMDQHLQSVQKGIVGAMSALSPILQLAYERADKDKELDELCGESLWDCVQLMAFSLNTLSARRRDLIKPALAPVYAQVLTKGHDTTPEWLYGGNLVETTKKVEVSKRISDKILKKKVQPAQQKQQAQQKPASRGRGRGQLRGFNPWYGMRFMTPQQQQAYVPYNQQQMGFQPDYQRMQRPQFYQPQQQQYQPQQQFLKKNAQQK